MARRGDGKREEILDGAAKVFARYGFRKTTVGDIVREAGVARATLYKYFETKDDVFEAVLDREAREMLAAVRDAVRQAGRTRERLRAAMMTHTDFIRRKVNTLRVTLEALSDMMSRWSRHMEELSRDAADIYESILVRGVEAGEIVADDAGATARILVMISKGLFLAVVTGRVDEDREAVVGRLLDMVMNGLRPREDAR